MKEVILSTERIVTQLVSNILAGEENEYKKNIIFGCGGDIGERSTCLWRPSAGSSTSPCTSAGSSSSTSASSSSTRRGRIRMAIWDGVDAENEKRFHSAIL